MVGEHLKMLSYADYAWAVGLRSTDATGAEAVASADRAHEAIQVDLRPIEHVPASLSRFVRTLSWPGAIVLWQACHLIVTPRPSSVLCPWVMRNCLGVIWTRPLNKPRNEVVANVSLRCRLWCLKCSPRQLQFLPLTTLSKPPASLLLSRVAAGARASRKRARDAGVAWLRPASLLLFRTRRLKLRVSLTRTRKRILAVGVGVGAVHLSPRMMCAASPPF